MKTEYIILFVIVHIPFIFVLTLVPGTEPACDCQVQFNATYDKITYKLCCEEICMTITGDRLLNIGPVKSCWILGKNNVTLKPIRIFPANYFLKLFLSQIFAVLIPMFFAVLIPMLLGTIYSELATFECGFVNFFLSLLVALISGFLSMLQIESDVGVISLMAVLFPFLVWYIWYKSPSNSSVSIMPPVHIIPINRFGISLPTV